MSHSRTINQLSVSDPVNSLMSWPVATVVTTDSLQDVARELTADEIGAAIVVHDGVLVGVVSERDLTGQLASVSDLSGLTAADVMTQHLVTVPPEAPIYEAARILQEARVRHLPVVSEGVVTGILSMRDVFYVLQAAAENGLNDLAERHQHVTISWRHQRALWLLTCPMCGREPDPDL